MAQSINITQNDVVQTYAYDINVNHDYGFSNELSFVTSLMDEAATEPTQADNTELSFTPGERL